MQARRRIWTICGSALGALVLVLTLALSLPGYSSARLAAKVSRALDKRIAILEGHISEEFSNSGDTHQAFEFFPEDMVLYRYEMDTLQCWHNVFPILNDDIRNRIGTRKLFSNGSVSPLLEIGEEYAFVCLGSKWYVARCEDNGYGTKVIAGIEICSENSSGGVIYLDTGCGGSAFTNCLFAGNEDFNQGVYGPPSSVGALTVAMGAAADHVDVVNCTFAHNISDGTVSAGGVRIVKGSVDIINSIFYDMIVGKNHQDGGRAVYASGADTSVRIRYSICETNVDFMSDGTASLMIGEGVLYADPMLVTDRDYFKPLYVDSGSGNGARRRFRATSTAAILKSNMHLKSRAGYVDEMTGAIIRFRGASSPALDAGDPAMSYVRECERDQVGHHGKRINMGFYGNTPSSTMTPICGAFLRVR